MIEPPLAPPWKGGGHAALLHRGAFSRSSFPLCKGELEGVVVNTNRTFSHPHSFVYKFYKPNDFLVFYFCNLSALSFNLAARASLSGWVENIC